MKDPHVQKNGAGLGQEGWSLAIWDSWRNCSPCCLTCTAGWGLLLTGVPGRRGTRNKEAGKPEGSLERREGSGLSSFCCVWRQMFSIFPALKGRKWWAQLELLGQTAPGFFFRLSGGLKWIVVLVAFKSVRGISLSALGICFLPVPWGKSPAKGAEGWSHSTALDETQDFPKTRTSDWALTHFQSRCYRGQQTCAPLLIPYKHLPL